MDSLYGGNLFPQGGIDRSLSNSSMVSSSLPDSYMYMSPYSYPYSTAVCDKDNIEDCIVHLNQLLLNMCLPTITKMADFTVPLINTAFDLMKRIQQDTKFREELETKMSRIITDYDRMAASQVRSKDEIEKLEREIALRQIKEKELAAKIRALTSSVKTEKDEVKRLMSTLENRHLQYRHNAKKTEREMDRLKEKLSRVLMDKTHKISQPEILNTLPRPEGKRATWKTNSKQVEEFYSMMLRDYEKQLKNLHSENHDLENCIEKLVHTLQSLMEQFQIKSVINALNNDCGTDPEEMDMVEGKANCDSDEAPSAFARCQELLQSFDQTCDTLHKYLEVNVKSCNQSSSVTEQLMGHDLEGEAKTELEQLKAKLQHYEDLMAFQEETLQKFVCKSHTEDNNNSFLHETQLIQEYEQLEMKKNLFLEAKGNFEKERLQHMNEAVQLAEEKKQFNQEKCQWIKEQILDWTPDAEFLNASSDLPPSMSQSAASKPDSCCTTTHPSSFTNSKPCSSSNSSSNNNNNTINNKQPNYIKNLGSGDAGETINLLRRSNSLKHSHLPLNAVASGRQEYCCPSGRTHDVQNSFRLGGSAAVASTTTTTTAFSTATTTSASNTGTTTTSTSTAATPIISNTAATAAAAAAPTAITIAKRRSWISIPSRLGTKPACGSASAPSGLDGHHPGATRR
ncbi:afadin- and alpha-actinin-binding protein A-like isoform X1, partial [Argonauta hians]